MRNLNLLFNKEYYEKLAPDTTKFQNDVIKNNKALINACFESNDYVKPVFDDCQCFRLKVVYPGLLIGTGNPHGIGKLEKLINKSKKDDDKNSEDINLGFSFDYVTGQPYIPGSSVKGVLRSHFKYHADAVKEILKESGFADITEEIVKKLEKAIFDNGDIFFDAVICKGDAEGKMLGFDYITPHSSPTKNPIPIRIIKVLPGVQFEFRFKIRDKEINEIKFSAGKIKWLFQELILLFGAGAKTNVGYGVFDDKTSIVKSDSTNRSFEANKSTDTEKESKKVNNANKKNGNIKQGDSIQSKTMKGLDSLAILLE